MAVFKKMKNFRESNNLTMRQVSERLGVTESCYCLYENGKRKPSIDVLKKLAKIYDCTIDDLV